MNQQAKIKVVEVNAAERQRIYDAVESLSQGSKIVIGYILAGVTNDEMSRRLSVSKRTVEQYRHDAFKALGVKNAVQMTLKLVGYHFHRTLLAEINGKEHSVIGMDAGSPAGSFAATA